MNEYMSEINLDISIECQKLICPKIKKLQDKMQNNATTIGGNPQERVSILPNIACPSILHPFLNLALSLAGFLPACLLSKSVRLVFSNSFTFMLLTKFRSDSGEISENRNLSKTISHDKKDVPSF